MFKKLMASLGVGAAKVNLVLDRGEARIGEAVTGKAIIQGGNVDQGIHTLDVDVIMQCKVRNKDFNRVVDSVRVAQDLTIRAGETKEIPFQHVVAPHYPVSKGSISYALQTKMDIAQAVDTGDRDPLTVLPSKEMQLIFDALQYMGFREKIGSGKIERQGQEFEFYPSEQLSEQLRELELKFYNQGNEMRLFLELELTGGYLRGGQEHHTEWVVPTELLNAGFVPDLAQSFHQFLENELQMISVQGPRLAPSYPGHQGHHAHRHGSPFGGFMGGMLTGMLGGALLGELFDGDDAEAAEADMGADSDMGGGEEGGFDFGLGDFMDFGGDDEF